MANVSGTGTLWNLPNYAGQLFTPSKVRTPFLDTITNAMDVSSPEFAMSSRYDMEAASQPAITETASLTAPTATSYVRSNEKNVCQIYQRQVYLSYAKMSDSQRLKRVEVGTSGFAYDEAGSNPVDNELAFQIATNMDQIKMDMEYTFLNGVYQLATDAGTAFKTRGLITGSTVNTVPAGGATITKAIMDSLFKEMADNGAFDQAGSFTIMCNSFNKQQLSDIYTYVPQDRSVGGSNIERIVTDFGEMEIKYVPRVPADTIVVVNTQANSVVFNPVAGKPVNEGRVILEPLAKTGAGEKYQLYVNAGIDYGSAYMHGTVTGTATS